MDGAIYTAYPGQKLATHRPELITQFLERKGKNAKLKGWKFIQIADAIQKLFAMLNAPIE